MDVAGWSCPLPLRNYERIVLGHGGGGKLSAELVEHLFRPAFGAAARRAEPTDAAVIEVGAGRLALSTDTYVVRPLFFPGGNIGDLAVNGTVNDLAMAGARPLALTTGFVLAEGLLLEELGRVAQSMGTAAVAAGVELLTGDTKVVEASAGDGLYVNTSGVGTIPDGVVLHPGRMRPGDAVIVSGPIGMHGVAVLSVREGLEFGTEICSDSQPLHDLVATLLAAAGGDPGAVRVLRDPTRGGLAASLCELSATAAAGIEFVEATVPVPPAVAAGCGFLGLDPLHVANEGKLVAVVAAEVADAVVAAMAAHPAGTGSVRIGTVTANHPGVVVARTRFGANRIVDLPVGEQLPRIC